MNRLVSLCILCLAVHRTAADTSTVSFHDADTTDNYAVNSYSKIPLDADCETTDKNCFQKCNSRSCRFRVKWKRTGDSVEFDVLQDVSYLEPFSMWIAIGFSKNKEMSGTSVVMCKYNDISTLVEIGHNQGHHYESLSNAAHALNDVSANVDNGIFSCHFQRLINVENRYVSSLSDPYYLLVGQGKLNLITGIPQQHFNDPTCTDSKINFTRSHDYPVTTSIPDLPILPARFNPDPECGVTKNCFRDCNSTDTCSFQVIWKEDGDFIDFTMSQIVSAADNYWVALGISDDTNMENTSVIMCKDTNGNITVEFGYNPGHTYRTLATNTSDLVNTSGSLEDGVFTCRFQRRKIIIDFNNTFPLTSKHFIMVAYGQMQSGIVLKHANEPSVSPEKQEFIHNVPEITTANPGEITTQPVTVIPSLDCGVTKGCFFNCVSNDSCTFQVTWHETGDFIDFTMSQNISDVDNTWIALGISDDTKMADTSVIMCKMTNGSISVELGYNPGYSYNSLATNTSDLIHTWGSAVDGVFTCNFQRRKAITDFNNTFSLTEKRYLIVANGILSSGAPVQHTNIPVVSPEKEDFIHFGPEITTVNPGEITTQPVTVIPYSDCGVTKGCFFDCVSNDSCTFQVTWQEAGDFIDFTMSQNISDVDNIWIALGISDDTKMKDTSVVMCKMTNGSISVELGYNPGYSYNRITTNTSDLIHTGGSAVDGVFTCNFQRRKAITDFNNTFSLTEKRYLIVANGILSSGVPVQHTNTPVVSPEKEDFIHISPEITTVNPGEITTQPSPIIPYSDCGVTKGCFFDCVSNESCTFQVTWQETGDFIDFTMSQNISDVDNIWIALGISDDTKMKDTSVVMCKMTNGSISVELGYNPGYSYNKITTNTSDLIHTGGSAVDGVFTCNFQRRKAITDFNNTFSLTEKRYLIVANGILSSGVPVQHTNTPVVSPEKEDFIHISPEITTVNPGEITTQPSPIIPSSDCGVTKGCFFDCVSNESCTFQVTWQETGDFIDFTMSQNISDVDNIWIALGISDDTKMKDTSVVMCKMTNGSISVELGYNPGYSYNKITTNTSDLIHTGGSAVDGVFTCNFQRRKAITDFNNTFSLTEKRYLIVANGILSSGVPVQHTNIPVVSPEKEDFIHISPEITTVNPGEITTQPGPLNPDCGVTKGCFYNCVSKDSCAFQVTWQEDGDFIDFTMSQNISDVDNTWIALGISDDTQMKDTSVIMCKMDNGNFSVELGYNPDNYYNTVATNTSDLIHTGGSYENGMFTCNFQRRITITDFNNTFSLTEKHYLIVANGLLASGIPQQHTSIPVVSRTKEDFINIVPDTTPVNPGEITTQSGTSIVKDPQCGKTKGCFSDCNSQGQSCTCLVTWQNEPKTKTIRFEIESVVTPGVDDWVAIALSPNAKMAKSSVMMCIEKNNVVTTELGYNTKDPNYVPLTNKTEYLSDMSGSLDGNIMRCTFQRANRPTDTFNADSSKIFDLDEQWYLLFAHGLAPSGIPERHKSKPLTSNGKIDFLKTGDTGIGKQKSGLVKLHGFLMILAWLILSTSGMLIARYFKPILHKKVMGKHLWFQIHRSLMYTVVILTLIALIVIFVEVGGFSKISVPDDIAYVKLHPVLGLIVVGLMLLNPTLAFFRCDHDHPRRPVFNWLHWGVAFVVQFIAGFNISFGFHLDKVNMPVNHSLIVMYLFTGTFIGMYIVFEVTKCIMKRNKPTAMTSSEIDEFSEDVNLVNDEEPFQQRWTSFKIFLGVHIVAMLCYGITLMAFLLNG